MIKTFLNIMNAESIEEVHRYALEHSTAEDDTSDDGNHDYADAILCHKRRLCELIEEMDSTNESIAILTACFAARSKLIDETH